MSGMSAQVGLYPLGKEDMLPAIDEMLHIFRVHGLNVIPGPMNTLITGDDESLFAALQVAFQRAAGHGRLVMVVTLSNAFPLSVIEESKVTFNSIGTIRNEFFEPAPQEQMRETESQIIINPNLAEGLHGLEPGQQLLVIFHFHRSEGYDLQQHPRGDQDRPKRGVFALRSPRRPNPIGVTLVDLIGVEDNLLRVRGLDAINGTPVLDIKPA
jgi:tRNA-Thr(GGU) m(6)t(6)A37 methyltransferase TsaA